MRSHAIQPLIDRAFSLLTVLGSLSCLSTPVSAAPESSAKSKLSSSPPSHCEVAIVGGGAGGLYTAFRLGPILGSKVCLFEKEAELGGRIYDLAKDPSEEDAPRFGIGARRIMETQTLVLDLAQELGLKLETPPLGSDLIQVRGQTSFQKGDFTPLYPGLPSRDDFTIDQETWLYNRLRFGPERKNARSFADFRSYISGSLGTASLNYLRDMSRFRADFEYPIDASSYLDYLDQEWDTCCKASYPVGGMSAFIRAMEQRARAAGVRIFKGEAVKSIDSAGKKYRLETIAQKLVADKLVLALPPSALSKLAGDVPRRIRQQSQFQDIIGIKVAVITQWWQSAWWKDIKNPALSDESAQVWRAWTTDSCINFIEIPLNPYAVSQNVTRSVYNDDQRCVEHWEKLAKTSPKALEAEVLRGLSQLFIKNGASVPENLTIPAPLKTHVQIWPAGWHFLGSGTRHSNEEVAKWALEPLAGEPVALVGEAYFIQRSGWSEAAYRSAINLLNSQYGLQLKSE